MKEERKLYDTHMHTPLCNHAAGEPEEYAEMAWRRGLKGIVITCHNPCPDGWSPKVRMSIDQFEDYVAMVERARRAWEGKIDVRLGLESDYVPGMEPWLEKLHARAGFNYILGSVHCHLPQYHERYYKGDPRSFQITYFEHLALSAESGFFDCVAHPDLVKNDHPHEWNPEEILDAVRHALDRIAVTGVAMELNTSGLNKRIAEMNPGPLILKEMQSRGIPVVVGSDAHAPGRVAADFTKAFDLLHQAGYTQIYYCLERVRRSLAIQEARQSLASAESAGGARDQLSS